MVVSIVLTENTRNKLGVVTAILCAVLALAGVCVICVGIFIQVHITDELILLESYDSGVIPHFLVSVGTLMFLINGVTVKFAYDSGFASTCEKFRLVLVPVLIVMFLFIWVVLAAGISTLSMRGTIEDALHDGLRDSMKRYKSSLPVKVAIDRLQMRSKCCGSRSFEDWFEVGWINTDYVDTTDTIVKRKMKDGDLFTDDVPFSCCDVRVHRPCVTNNVENKSKHRNYEMVTLYGKGCTEVLMDEFENKIIHPTGSVIMALFGAQAFVMILLRYLQTSVQSAFEEGDPEGPGKGFLLPTMCKSCTGGNAEKYKEGALKSIRGESTDQDTTADTVDDSMLAELQSVPDFDQEPNDSTLQNFVNVGDGDLEYDSFSSLPELESGAEYLSSISGMKPRDGEYIARNEIKNEWDSGNLEKTGSKKTNKSDFKVKDVNGNDHLDFKKRDSSKKESSKSKKKDGSKRDSSRRKSMFTKLSKKEQTPKKSKSPRMSKSPNGPKLTKQSRSPKRSKSPKMSKSHKRSNTHKSSKSRKRSKSPKMSKSHKRSNTHKSSKPRKRSKSTKRSKSHKRSNTHKSSKSRKRSKSTKRSKSHKRS